MTRVEKETVCAALSEYAYRHVKAAEKHHRKHEYDAERTERARANIAGTILGYWRDVVEAPCGSVII